MLENVYCSIDRLTILANDKDMTRTGVSVVHKLREYLADKLSGNTELRIIDYQDAGTFGVAWYELGEYEWDDREENLIFIHVFRHGADEDIRIDFNPNSLIKHNVEYVWKELKSALSLLRLDLRLSRFDLAFDIINSPEIRQMKNVKGGVTRKEFYGRSGDLETIYWGSQASSVQVRLYNKLAELGGKVGELYNTIPELTRTDDYGRFLVNIKDAWRLEMQMRTKVIDENLADEVVSRLEHFSLSSVYGLDLKPEMKIFADMYLKSPENVSVFYSDVDERTLRRWKSKVRKVVQEANDDYVNAIKKALQRDSEKLNQELKNYCDDYLGF